MLKAFNAVTGNEVKKGDVIKDFRGDEHIFVMPTREKTLRSGKVLTNQGEFYDGVFRLVVKKLPDYRAVAEANIFLSSEAGIKKIEQLVQNGFEKVGEDGEMLILRKELSLEESCVKDYFKLKEMVDCPDMDFVTLAERLNGESIDESSFLVNFNEISAFVRLQDGKAFLERYFEWWLPNDKSETCCLLVKIERNC